MPDSASFSARANYGYAAGTDHVPCPVIPLLLAVGVPHAYLFSD